VNDEWIKLNQDQITPWCFMMSGPPFRVKTFYGKTISYQGVEFEGSPQLVFWKGYIEPFIEDITIRIIDYVVDLCHEKSLSVKSHLNRTEDILKALSVKTYNRMAEIDQRLRGKGYPQLVKKRDVTGNIAAMNGYISVAIMTEIDANFEKMKDIGKVGLNGTEWYQKPIGKIGIGIIVIILGAAALWVIKYYSDLYL